MKIVRPALAFALVASLMVAPGVATATPTAVFPTLWPNLVSYYDFQHPVPGNPNQEKDRGSSGTPIDLVNGDASMRAWDGSGYSLQTRQVDPAVSGNDDWKAGTYATTLSAFNAVRGTTVMGWVKMTGTNPSPNSGTADPNDFYNAIGLAGILTGNSDGHAVRALLELIQVNGELKLVALGRRIDGGASQTFAADEDWKTLLPDDEWVFLAATFDFDLGTMALYRNGKPLAGTYVTPGDPWELSGPGPHLSSPTNPHGIKIGGSFPQNTREGNPCNCRFDDLMFLDRAVTPIEVYLQYRISPRGR